MANTLRGAGFLAPREVPKNLRVWRDGVDLGSLYFVKLAFTIWMDEKDAEADSTGLEWRRRRSTLGAVWNNNNVEGSADRDDDGVE